MDAQSVQTGNTEIAKQYQRFRARVGCGNQPACAGLHMGSLSRRSLLMGSVSLSVLPKPGPEQVYLFATDEYEIRMTLEFYDRYDGRLQFQERSQDRHFCLSVQGEENRNCAGNFQGSMAVVRYKISPRLRPGNAPSLREYVRNIDQSERIPARPPFERVIATQYGLASDIQAFGYGNSPSAQDARSADTDDAWCLYRQDLYLQGKIAPFLIVHWKHSLSAIRVLDMIPQNGTSRQQRADARG